jgi:hypothetical protein
MSTLNIRELDLNIIPPFYDKLQEPDQGGPKIVIIGKPKSGKSWLIRSLLYNKKHIFPVGMVCSGTEDSNSFYGKMFPDTFIYEDLNTDAISNFVRRQRLAKKHLPHPWAVLVLDDCMDKPGLFRQSLFQGIFKNSRHWCCMVVMAMQYSMDIPPNLRTCIDGTFIFREPNAKYRKNIYENYAGIIPDFKMFCELMDQLTDDHTAIYIHNVTQSNNVEDCVFWYKAKAVPDEFKVGCKDYWLYHEERYDDGYAPSL